RKPGDPGSGRRRRGHAAGTDPRRSRRRASGGGDHDARRGPDSGGRWHRHRRDDSHPDDDYGGLPVRVVVAGDKALVRPGLAVPLTTAGVRVLGEAVDADELLGLVARTVPDAALIDIKMPPTHTDEG